MRLAVLLATVAVGVAAYFLLLVNSLGPDIAQERVFGGSSANRAGRVYLEVVGVDTFRDAMQVRISLEPDDSGIDGQPPQPDRELTLILGHDNRTERILIHSREPSPSTTVELDLSGGDVSSYPWDAYRAGLTVQCVPGSAPSATAPPVSGLPISLTTWDRVFGFRLRTGFEVDAATQRGRLSFDIQRGGAIEFFAVAAYAAMIVLAGVSVSIGTLAFVRVRRAEPTLVGALGAIVFALPALRNNLPGAPPLGVAADLLIYLWAELAAVLALVLLVATWARTGARPDASK